MTYGNGCSLLPPSLEPARGQQYLSGARDRQRINQSDEGHLQSKAELQAKKKKSAQAKSRTHSIKHMECLFCSDLPKQISGMPRQCRQWSYYSDFHTCL